MTEPPVSNPIEHAGKGKWLAIAVRAVSCVIGGGMIATSVIMIFRPMLWYGGFPGVSETGPFNPHFVRDIGAAYLAAGAALLLASVAPRPPLGALIAIGGFLVIHAMIHVGDLAAMPPAHVLAVLGRDLGSVYLPPVATICLACLARRREEAMLSRGSSGIS